MRIALRALLEANYPPVAILLEIPCLTLTYEIMRLQRGSDYLIQQHLEGFLRRLHGFPLSWPTNNVDNVRLCRRIATIPKQT